jgi:hypothetical protein
MAVSAPGDLDASIENETVSGTDFVILDTTSIGHMRPFT